MAKKYYCDYCDNFIPSNKQSIKNHNKGITHLKNRNIYYSSFSSLFINQDLAESRQQLNWTKVNELNKDPYTVYQTSWEFYIPSSLPKRSLPPSLKPPPIHGYKVDPNVQWG